MQKKDEEIKNLRNNQIKKLKRQIKEIKNGINAKIKKIKKEGKGIPEIVQFRKKEKRIGFECKNGYNWLFKISQNKDNKKRKKKMKNLQ